MAAFSGPEISNGGLVFDYDMSNTQKSWMGAPTTNLISITNWNNSFSGWASWFWVTGATTSDSVNVLYPGVNVLQGTITGVAAGGPAYLDLGGLSTTLGTTYAVSVWFKSSSRGCYAYSHDTLGAGTIGGNTITPNGIWQKSTYIFTVVSTTGAMRLHLVATIGSVNDVIYVTAPQVELMPFSTPFVNGTRSTTQAILDLTGNNTITATSLTYASDNTFSFNGTSNYVDLGSLPSSIGSSITVCAFAKISSVVSKNTLLSINGAYNFFLPGNRLTSTNQLYWDSASGWKNGNTTSWNTNQWYWLAWTISGTTLTFYVNGVADGSVTLAGVIAPSGATRIGLANAGEYATGTIGTVQLYSRALSATEVSLNFEAMRDRYGI